MKMFSFGVFFALFSIAFGFDGTEFDGVLPIVQTLVAGGTAIVISIGVFRVGANVFRRMSEGIYDESGQHQLASEQQWDDAIENDLRYYNNLGHEQAYQGEDMSPGRMA